MPSLTLGSGQETEHMEVLGANEPGSRIIEEYWRQRFLEKTTLTLPTSNK
jgi:hypothetical protein